MNSFQLIAHMATYLCEKCGGMALPEGSEVCRYCGGPVHQR